MEQVLELECFSFWGEQTMDTHTMMKLRFSFSSLSNERLSILTLKLNYSVSQCVPDKQDAQNEATERNKTENKQFKTHSRHHHSV